MTDDVDALIAERKKTHGDFRQKSELAQAFKQLLHSSPNWKTMTAVQREGIEFVVDKLSRALVGDPFFKDHYMDMMGYLKRIIEDNEKTERDVRNNR